MAESDDDDEYELILENQQSELGMTQISPEEEDLESQYNDGAGEDYIEPPLKHNGSAGSNTGIKIMYISMQYCDGETL